MRIVFEATRQVAEDPVGTVVAGDIVYDQQRNAMLQNGVLLREMDVIIQEQADDKDDGKLRSRLCATIFLVNQLPQQGVLTTGLRADDRHPHRSTGYRPNGKRPRQPNLFGAEGPFALECAVGREHIDAGGGRIPLADRVKAPTGNRTFDCAPIQIIENASIIETKRNDALRTTLTHQLKDTRLTQGNSKVHRKLSYNFFTQEAPDTDTSDVPIWVQTGWDTSGNRLRDEAQAAGTDSPIVFLFIPRMEADAFKEALARREAASEVLNARPNDPTSGEAMEARKAMETHRDLAGAEVKRLVGTVLESARVYQGGGNEIVVESLPESVEQAAKNALVRLFPNFTSAADDSRWAAVLRRAIGGNGDSLTALGFNGDAAQHPVCKEVLTFVGSGGKRGGDVRKHFMGAGYGWPQDTVDGALLALLASNVMRATKNGQPVAVTAIPQNQIGVHDFEVEDVTVSTSQRIQIRSFLSEMGFGQIKSGEEVQGVLQMLRRLQEFGAEAGGESPVSAKPDSETIDALQALQGNALLAGIYESRDELKEFQAECKRRRNLIAERLPKWALLLRLLDQAGDQRVARAVNVQVDAIRSERSLLAEPDPVTPVAGATH